MPVIVLPVVHGLKGRPRSASQLDPNCCITYILAGIAVSTNTRSTCLGTLKLPTTALASQTSAHAPKQTSYLVLTHARKPLAGCCYDNAEVPTTCVQLTTAPGLAQRKQQRVVQLVYVASGSQAIWQTKCHRCCRAKHNSVSRYLDSFNHCGRLSTQR